MSSFDQKDVAVLKALAGSSFEGELKLPSGRRLAPEEATALAAAYLPDTTVVQGAGLRDCGHLRLVGGCATCHLFMNRPAGLCVHGNAEPCARCIKLRMSHETLVEGADDPIRAKAGSGGLLVGILLLAFLGICALSASIAVMQILGRLL